MNQNAAGASSKLATAMQLIGQRKYVDAESILRELLASGSELAESFYGMGLIRFASSQMDAAATQFGNCVRLQPDNANAHYYLGQIAERSGDNTAAERFFEKALEINPKHAGALKKRPAHRDGHTSTPVARPTHDDEHITEGQPADGDLYSVLRRSNEPVEREMVRHMDAIAAMVGTRRSRSRAFLNVPLVVATLASLGMLTIAFIVAGNARNSRQVEPVMAPALIALAVLFLVAVALLKGRSATITCERDWLVLSKGMLRRSTVNKHLYLLSRHPVSVHQSLMNRITNDGTLALGPATLLRELTLRGFFRRAELDALSANFRQLSMLNPSNREVLATLGELKQIRSGAM